jgi:FkbM family methyltransferase
MTMLAELLGIARSFRMYYGNPSQTRRMVRFYGRFIRPGDLCFDVGAHIGSRVAAWSRMGTRVVAVEPMPNFARLLRWMYGRRPNVAIVQAALGAEVGERTMLVSDRQPTVSTLSPAWAAKPWFAEARWDRSVAVPMTTLDALIARYGEPVFCKLDTEGYDLEVLRGLSRPVRALSVECVPAAREVALSCLDRLGELGRYEFNWSSGESMRLALPRWVGPEQIEALLRALPDGETPGDVYARLREAAVRPRSWTGAPICPVRQSPGRAHCGRRAANMTHERAPFRCS